MKSLNLTKKYASYYTAAPSPEVVDVEGTVFVSITAKGSFTEDVFYERIALLKKTLQLVIDTFKDSDQAFEQSVLEGLYWNDKKYGEHTISQVFDAGPLDELNYRLMIRVPEYVTKAHVLNAQKTLVPADRKLSKGVELFKYQEGRCIQMLHKGPFIYELETLNQLEEFAANNNLSKGGIHHEIYLVDFTDRGPQDHLRTILREPVQ